MENAHSEKGSRHPSAARATNIDANAPSWTSCSALYAGKYSTQKLVRFLPRSPRRVLLRAWTLRGRLRQRSVERNELSVDVDARRHSNNRQNMPLFCLICSPSRRGLSALDLGDTGGGSASSTITMRLVGEPRHTSRPERVLCLAVSMTQ